MDEQTYALATKAAWYYYMEDNTQAQIAEVMGVSRAKVIRLLEEARAQGIVQFSFRKNDSQRVSAEQLLIDRFGLKDAFVVPTPLDSSTTNLLLRAQLTTSLTTYARTATSTLATAIPSAVCWEFLPKTARSHLTL